MPTHVAPRRDFHGLEVRRKQAARLFATGRETQGAIARRLGVSRQSVMRWYQAWRSGGREAARAAGRAGGKARLGIGRGAWRGKGEDLGGGGSFKKKKKKKMGEWQV